MLMHKVSGNSYRRLGIKGSLYMSIITLCVRNEFWTLFPSFELSPQSKVMHTSLSPIFPLNFSWALVLRKPILKLLLVLVSSIHRILF